MAWTQSGNIKGASGVPGASGAPGASGVPGATGPAGATGASGGTGGPGASGASGASGTPGPTRSISTITSNTTLGNTANTDYVTFVSNTPGGAAASYVASTGMNNWSYSGSAAQVKNYTHTTGTANYVFVFVHVLVFLGNGTPSASVTFGGTSMTQLASRFNAGNECSGFLFGLSGSFSGSYTVGVTLSGHNQGFRATSLASTYSNVSSVGTAVSGSTSITVNSASNVVAFSGSRDGTSGITLTGSTSRLSQQDASGSADIYSQTIDLLSSSASNRSITSSRAGIVGIAVEGASPAVPTLPGASGNSSLYTIKNISGSSVTIGVTSNQLIDGASGGLALTNNSTARLISDGSGWRTV